MARENVGIVVLFLDCAVLCCYESRLTYVTSVVKQTFVNKTLIIVQHVNSLIWQRKNRQL